MLLDLFKRQIQRSDIPIMTRKNTKATLQAKGAPHAKAFQSRTLEDETPPHKAPDSNPHYQHPQLPERKASGIHSSKAWVLNYHGDRLRACAAPVPGFWHCSVKLAQTPKSQSREPRKRWDAESVSDCSGFQGQEATFLLDCMLRSFQEVLAG